MSTSWWILVLTWSIIVPLITIIEARLKSEKKGIILFKCMAIIVFINTVLIWGIENNLPNESVFSVALLFCVSVPVITVFRYGDYIVKKIEYIEKQINDINKEK